MAIVKAFQGVRYNLEKVLLKQVISPPYDVISDEMREVFVSRSDHNIVKIDLPVGGESRYTDAAALYGKWIEDNYLLKDDEPSYYLYEQEYVYDGKTYTRTGFFGLLKLSEFGKGIVYPHEKTHAGPKIDRYELMKASSTNMSSIFGLYSDNGKELKPTFDSAKNNTHDACAIDDDGVKHRLWKVSDKKMIDDIGKFMEDKSIYIADGHHRYETALTYRDDMRKAEGIDAGVERDYDYVLMMFINFCDDGLNLFSTHRVVDVDADYNEEAFLKNLSVDFNIEKLGSIDEMNKVLDANNGTFGRWCFMGLTGIYSMFIKDEVYNGEHEIYREIYTYLLENKILKKELCFTDNKLSHKDGIHFIQGVDGASKYMSEHRSIAFILNPESLDVIKKVSEAGLVMPQKSTYFYPKIATGFVINNI